MSSWREMHLSRMEKLAGGFILLLWCGMILALLDREFFLFTDMQAVPASTTSDTSKADLDCRMGIYDNTKRIGFSQSTTEVHADGSSRLHAVTEVRMQIPLMGKATLPIRIVSDVDASAEGAPQKLNMNFSAGGMPALGVDISGVRVGDGMEIVISQEGRTLFKNVLALPDGASFGAGLLPIGNMTGLSVGKEWPVSHVNPIWRKTERGMARVVSYDTLSWNGRDVKAYQVVITMNDNASMNPVAYILPDGRLIELQGVYGYRFVREEMHDSDSGTP